MAAPAAAQTALPASAWPSGSASCANEIGQKEAMKTPAPAAAARIHGLPSMTIPQCLSVADGAPSRKAPVAGNRPTFFVSGTVSQRTTRGGKGGFGAAVSLAAAKADVYNSRPSNGGAVAQLGERLVRNEKVRSSILLGSTNFLTRRCRTSPLRDEAGETHRRGTRGNHRHGRSECYARKRLFHDAPQVEGTNVLAHVYLLEVIK